MRFRKRIKLAPGLRLNLSGSGLSLTTGLRGASFNFGKRGAFFNTGVPGTGLYSRTPLSSGSARQAPSSGRKVSMEISFSVGDDGTIRYCDAAGNPLSEELIAQVKKHRGDALREAIAEKCAEINDAVSALGEIHRHTPSPDEGPRYDPQVFPEGAPVEPQEKSAGFLGMLFRSRRERIALENEQARQNYEAARDVWQRRRAEFDLQQAARKRFIEEEIRRDVSAMEVWLEENLGAIEWPRETVVSFDLSSDGERVSIDVDLPEVEEMPTKTASVPARGYKLSIKEMSPAQVQRLYMRHVHGVGFRIIGEAFADLPTLKEVVLSAYTQRPDAATGEVRDEYIYSARVQRGQWQQIRFENLEALDLVEALARFELRREMTKAGKFKAVEPIAAS